MTIPNSLAGFKVTGIHPFDQNALVADTPKKALAKKKGLQYIPVITPHPSREPPTTPRFSMEEFCKFKECFDKGCDLPDEQYQLWKQIYCPYKSPCKTSDFSIDDSFSSESFTGLLYIHGTGC